MLAGPPGASEGPSGGGVLHRNISIPNAVVQRRAGQSAASPNPFLPRHSLATALLISASARGMGSWEKAADSYFSSRVGSGGRRRGANEAEVRGRSPPWAR